MVLRFFFFFFGFSNFNFIMTSVLRIFYTFFKLGWNGLLLFSCVFTILKTVLREKKLITSMIFPMILFFPLSNRKNGFRKHQPRIPLKTGRFQE